MLKVPQYYDKDCTFVQTKKQRHLKNISRLCSYVFICKLKTLTGKQNLRELSMHKNLFKVSNKGTVKKSMGVVLVAIVDFAQEFTNQDFNGLWAALSPKGFLSNHYLR